MRKRLFRAFARDEGGATMIEYAFIVLVVSVALGIGGAALGDMIGSVSQRVTQKVQIGDKPCGAELLTAVRRPPAIAGQTLRADPID